MIGNVAEVTAEWDTGTTDSFLPDAAAPTNWGGTPLFSDDTLDRVGSHTYLGRNGEAGLARRPSVWFRGGSYFDGTGAGINYVNVADSPGSSRSFWGFRCVIPR